MAALDDESKKFLDQKVYAHVATLMPDGSPQVSPVWIDHDDTHVIFNTSEGRHKTENLEQDGRIAVSITDPENPYEHMLVRGNVAELRREGANEHADALAKKYMDVDEYPFLQPGEVRVIVLIDPDSVTLQGG